MAGLRTAFPLTFTPVCADSKLAPLYTPFWRTLKGKRVKLHTLDIAPLRSESPPQKRSGMARVLKGFHDFTCTPTRVHPQPE